MDEKTLNKFFTNSCSRNELERVLEWFDTPEGRIYLEKRLHADINRVEDLSGTLSEADSRRILDSIRKKSYPFHKFETKRNPRKSSFFLAAAIILLTSLMSIWFLVDHTPQERGPVTEEAPHYSTGEDEQQQLTLSDGSTIRINSHSRFWIEQDYGTGTREVHLEGEAWFDVATLPDQPFRIHLNQATVEVLGTSFNVRAPGLNSDGSVQVAVVNGRVSLTSEVADVQQNRVILEQGQFAYLDTEHNEIRVEEFGIENYLVWMSGRLVFDELPMNNVCIQLNRLYDLECSFPDESIGDLLLTADFSVDSVDKILSVISLTLRLNVETEGNTVIWFYDYDDME